MTKFLGFDLSPEQEQRAFVPKDTAKRHEMAHRCAKMHQERNRADPFAYKRAFNAVMRGLLDENDFKSGNISL